MHTAPVSFATTRPVGLAGLGLLGRGIAACLLGRGFRVVAVVPHEDEFFAARPSIDRMLDELVERDGLDPKVRGTAVERLVCRTDFESLRDAAFVIESVTEDVSIKRSVFDALERVVGDEVVIASNTSAIPIGVLQEERRRPDRFLGMHWAEPAHATRFLELVRGPSTSDAAMEAALRLGRLLGKDPTICRRDVPGFVVNRIAYAMYREALHLVESGVADFETIDRSLRNTLGLWAASCGPFRWIDLTGGPALYARAMERVLPTLDATTTIPEPLAGLAARGDGDAPGTRLFHATTPEETERWEERQRRHVWLVKRWLDEEFPLESATDGDAT